jgi:hypothetical protein
MTIEENLRCLFRELPLDPAGDAVGVESSSDAIWGALTSLANETAGESCTLFACVAYTTSLLLSVS